MKIIGIPGAVKTTAAPRVERFFEYQLSACAGQIISGTRCCPLESASCDSVKITRSNARPL